MKKALAIIAYARHKYFELVLPSILNQSIKGIPIADMYDIYVFQDGLWEGECEENKIGHSRISALLNQLPSSISVFRHEKNLAVAMHFDYIEKLLFSEKEYDFVVFCEDDLILAPGYMAAVDAMGEKFLDDRRVGMVSAHPANCTVDLQIQRTSRHRYAPMGHNWGFGLSRSFWEKRQPFVECYLDLIRNKPYRNRDHNIIYKWLELCGFSAAASSQDYVKQCATFALGACRLSTFINFGLPIGQSGLHCNPALFKKMGFQRTVVFDGEIEAAGDLDQEQFEQIYQNGGSQIGESNVKPIGDRSVFDHGEWQRKLNAGEFHPSRILLNKAQCKVTFIHTSDPYNYYPMLLETSKPVREYCQSHDFKYESFIGYKRGGKCNWHATFNRIVMLKELLDRGERGWVVYLDADAYVFNLGFDLREYLIKHNAFIAIFTPGAGRGRWDVNAGVFMINLGSHVAGEIIHRWNELLWKIPNAAFEKDTEWGMSFSDDQKMLQDILMHGDYDKYILLENHDFINSARASFIRTVMRAPGRSLSDRIKWIRDDLAKSHGSVPDSKIAKADSGPATIVKTWKASDIAARPSLDQDGLALLEKRLQSARIYLEYGAGGSTILAANIGVKEIHSVDSDNDFLNAVQKRASEQHTSAIIHPYYVDIGPTKEWGVPIDHAQAMLWPRYCVAPWQSLQENDTLPDLVLIDGRFRVACFFVTLLLGKIGTIILFDDYYDRPHYHIVEKFVAPSNKAGRMAEFLIARRYPKESILLDLIPYCTNPA